MIEEKQLLLDDLVDKISSSKGYIVAQYQDFPAARSNQFRSHLAQLGAEFEVVPKRVFLKAAEATGSTFDPKLFTGHIGVVFAKEDATQAVKGTVQFSENNNNTIIPIAGHIEGALCNKEELQALATLPSLEVLRSQIVGLIQAPMAQTVGALQAVLTAPLYCLEEKAKQS